MNSWLKNFFFPLFKRRIETEEEKKNFVHRTHVITIRKGGNFNFNLTISINLYFLGKNIKQLKFKQNKKDTHTHDTKIITITIYCLNKCPINGRVECVPASFCSYIYLVILFFNLWITNCLFFLYVYESLSSKILILLLILLPFIDFCMFLCMCSLKKQKLLLFDFFFYYYYFMNSIELVFHIEVPDLHRFSELLAWHSYWCYCVSQFSIKSEGERLNCLFVNFHLIYIYLFFWTTWPLKYGKYFLVIWKTFKKKINKLPSI